MRSASEVTSRIQILLGEELDRRVKEASERLPHRCVHNYRHSLDTRKQVDGERNEGYNRITTDAGLPVSQTIGLCLLGSENPEEWGGTICEEPIDAKKCPLFNPAKGKDEILPELEAQLQDPTWVQKNLPEVHALMWVVEATQLQVPWWKRLLFFFKVIKTEPVLPPIDPSKLLPPAT